MTDSDIKYWWGWDQNKYRWRVPLTSACSLAGACCPGFQMIHLVKDKLDDGNYTSCQALAPCSRSGRPPRGRFWCWTTPPWGMCFKYRINCSKNKRQKPWSKENPEHSSGSVDSGRKSYVNTSRKDKHQLKGPLTMFMVLSLPWNWRTLLLFEAVHIVGSSSSSSSWQTCYRYVTMYKKNFQNQREKNRSHRVLRLGLHPRQGWIGGVEMREHLPVSWSVNLKQRRNEILIVNLQEHPILV